MLTLESLEARDCPAIALVGGVLAVVGTDGPDTIDVRVLAANTGSVVQATLNGTVQTFAAASVSTLVLAGGRGADDISSFNTSIPATVLGGPGDDMIQTGPATDVIDTGAGRDVVYAILGPDVIYSQEDGKEDLLFGSAAGQVFADAADQVVIFFGAGRTPGAGSVQLQGGVLYLTPPDGGSSTQVFRQGANVLLVTDWAGVQSFRARDINFIGYFGGNGNDTYVNETNIREVGYGGLGGNDTLTGGTGGFTFLKGGSGNDTLTGRAKVNDLAGQAGADILVSLAGKSRLRVDALDTVFSRPGDLFFLP